MQGDLKSIDVDFDLNTETEDEDSAEVVKENLEEKKDKKEPEKYVDFLLCLFFMYLFARFCYWVDGY